MYSYIFYLTLNKEATIPGKHFRKDLCAIWTITKDVWIPVFESFIFRIFFSYESTVKFLFQK